MPENTPVTRAANGKWLKGGQSPNPGGRPPGLASHIREKTNDCREVADFFLGVMRGTAIVDSDTGDVVVPSLRDRMDAGRWLAERGCGKVAEVQADEFRELSDEELIARLQSELARRVGEQPTGAAQ